MFDSKAWLIGLSMTLTGACVGTTPDDETSADRSVTQGLTADGRFPDSFLFGSAIAGFQAEMGCPTLPRASLHA